jgi:hypothetical protein
VPLLDRLTWDDPATIAVQTAIALTVVVTLLLLVTARLPIRPAVAATAWIVAAAAVAARVDGHDGPVGLNDPVGIAALAVAATGLALLGWYAWLWRKGGLLLTVSTPARTTGRSSQPADGTGRGGSRHDPDPTLAPGRHQPDLRSAYDNLDRGFARSAIRDAGPVLEDVIDTWVKRGLGVREVPVDMTMHDRINRVTTMGHLTAQQRAQVNRWWGLRNRVSHELGPVAQADAREMVDGVTRLAARSTKR